MIFRRTTPPVIATLVFGLALSGTALACSTDGWNATVGAPNVVVGQPFGATPPDANNIARFEELCALQATNTGHVQTNSPSHSEVSNRVNVWPSLTGPASDTPFLIGYSAEDGTGELFRIGFNGTHYTFATTGGGSTTFAAPPGWAVIEYYWDSNADMFSFWVNSDATMAAADGMIDGGAGPATLESVRLGLPNGRGTFTGGFINFDSFEMHNTTAIGPVFNCNADPSNNTIDFNDILAQYNEIFNGILATGTPDCNMSGGAIDFNDILAVYNIVF